MLRMTEVYALENAVFYIEVYGPYKPYISCIRNTECSKALEINCTTVIHSRFFFMVFNISFLYWNLM